jgi:hypothetical protein
MDLAALPREDRLGILVAQYYELCRKEEQRFYKLPLLDEQFLNSPLFKQCKTLAEWLEKDVGWCPMSQAEHWKGFIRYSFRAITMPMPGQMKNRKLVSDYLKSAGTLQVKPEGLTDEQLARLYNRVLRPDLKNVGGFQRRLGLPLE